MEVRSSKENLNFSKYCYTATYIGFLSFRLQSLHKSNISLKTVSTKMAFRRIVVLGNKKVTFLYCPQLRGGHCWIYVLHRPSQTTTHPTRKICPALIFPYFLQNEKFILIILLRKISVNDLQTILIIKRLSDSEMTKKLKLNMSQYCMSRSTIFLSVLYLHALWGKDFLLTGRQRKVS